MLLLQLIIVPLLKLIFIHHGLNALREQSLDVLTQLYLNVRLRSLFLVLHVLLRYWNVVNHFLVFLLESVFQVDLKFELDVIFELFFDL